MRRGFVQSGAVMVTPLLITLALHGLLLFALLQNWSFAKEQRHVKPLSNKPVVQATLVDASTLQPAKAKPKPKPKEQTRKKPVNKPKPAPKTSPKKTPAKKKPPPKKVEPKPDPKPKPKVTQEELAAQARAALLDSLADEDAAEAASTAEEMSASYQALIQQAITRNWSRPPSARNGMEAVLALQLIPTGEVVNVSVVRGSGDAAFDRSAINAVHKAGRFEELKNLPIRLFERDFRRLRILFKPEDSRY